MAFSILSLDGGGIRGVLTARLLERIADVRPDYLPQVQLFAGTSTGSILAIGLANGLSPSQLVRLYQNHGRDIFHTNVLREIVGVGSLFGAKYTTQERFEGLRPYFENITLDDLLPRHVLVASFQLDSHNVTAPDPSVPRRWKAKFFHNFPGEDSDGHQKALDVILRSSAAPVYFPIYQGFIDGGVVANNPSTCALVQAIHPQTGGQALEDIALLSLGTGTKPEYLTDIDSNWGIAEWNFKLIDMLFDSGSGLADYQCQQLLRERYCRLPVNFEENIGLDAVDKIEELIQQANTVDLTATLQFIDAQRLALPKVDPKVEKVDPKVEREGQP